MTHADRPRNSRDSIGGPHELRKQDVSGQSSVVQGKEQRLFLQNESVNINELGAKIHEKLLDPTRQSIYLRADEAVPWGSLSVVMDHLNLAGITNIVIVTQPLDKSKK